MRKLTLVISTAALALAGAAIAQTAPTKARAPQTDMTRAQAQTRAEAMFGKFDANKDGIINEADSAAMKAQMFDRMDSDKNGSISRAEFDAMHANRGANGEGRMAHGGKRGHRGMMAGNMRKANTPMTRQAFVDRAMTMFDKSDTNKDGTVTVAERKMARDTIRQQWKAKAAARQQG